MNFDGAEKLAAQRPLKLELHWQFDDLHAVQPRERDSLGCKKAVVQRRDHASDSVENDPPASRAGNTVRPHVENAAPRQPGQERLRYIAVDAAADYAL